MRHAFFSVLFCSRPSFIACYFTTQSYYPFCSMACLRCDHVVSVEKWVVSAIFTWPEMHSIFSFFTFPFELLDVCNSAKDFSSLLNRRRSWLGAIWRCERSRIFYFQPGAALKKKLELWRPDVAQRIIFRRVSFHTSNKERGFETCLARLVIGGLYNFKRWHTKLVLTRGKETKSNSWNVTRHVLNVGVLHYLRLRYSGDRKENNPCKLAFSMFPLFVNEETF